jgi:predicted esterase
MQGRQSSAAAWGTGIEMSDFDIEKEKFRLIISGNYSTNSEWGLFVWISPSNQPRIPAAWEPEFAREQLLVVAPYGGGNDRHPLDRCQLALDATCNTCRRFKINPKRIYVGGFSGGARIASMLGVCYSDLFSGTLAVCGVDFYRPVPAAAGGYYPESYRPDARILGRAMKAGRFVLLTGEKDVNRDNTKSTAEEGFKANGFNNVLYLEVAGMKHDLPGPADLNRALRFLASGSVSAGDP